MKQDWDNYVTQSGKNISLLAKWIPREKSKRFKWLFNLLARDYYSVYLKSAKEKKSRKRAVLKAYCDYVW